LRFDLKLSQKGLLLVAIPLLCQIVFIALLAGLIGYAEREESIAKRGERITARIGNVSKHLIEAELALIGYGCRHTPSLKEGYEANDAQIPLVFDDLKKLTKDVPETATSITNLEVGANELRRNMRISLAAIEGGNWMPAVARLAGQSTSSYFLVRHEIEAITKQIRKSFITDKQEEEMRTRIWAVLIVTLVSNIIITVLMSLYFSKNISGRLAILSDNALRVRDRKELNPLISGSDEIAELDRVFHQMSSALTKAEQTKAEFISMISHDLRSPLTSLQFTFALAEKGAFGEINEKGKERFSRAEYTVERLVKLINELLDIEKMEAGMLNMVTAPEELDPIVKRAVDSVAGLAEAKSIEVEALPSALEVNVEADRIVQVLVNLISNAIKFSPDNSKITVSATELPTGIKVTVADQGRGIPEDKVRSIFDRFSQVEHEDATTYGGTGLGLAICKAIIEGHGGIIGVDSVDGDGSRFWFIVQKC
jgi:signal transduction histidine kinase